MEFGPWEIYNGGGCPVEPGTLGQIQRRGDSATEAEQEPVCALTDWNWDMPQNSGHAIHAFRRVKKPVTAVMYMHYHCEWKEWLGSGEKTERDTHILTFTINADGDPSHLLCERIKQ